MSVDQNKTCNVCLPNSDALCILFTYASAFALSETGIAPFGAHLVQTDTYLVGMAGLPPLKNARYVFRLLRPGYLYIYHPEAPKWLKAIRRRTNNPDPQAVHWEVFRVTESGPLIPDYEPMFYNKSEDFHCTLDLSHRYTALTYRLRDASHSGPIKAAFSANLWNAKLRAQNIDNGAMITVDVPKLIGGDLPTGMVAAVADWIDTNIVEFCNPYVDHKDIIASLPVHRSYYSEAKTLAKRMAEMDGDSPATRGRSAVMALPDPAGTGIALADISRAQHRVGLKRAEEERLRLGTAAKLALLQRQAYDTELVHARSDRPVMSTLPTNAVGQPLDAAGRPLYAEGQALPPMAERSRWGSCGSMRREGYEQGIRNKGLPTSARWYPLRGDPSMGEVYAPLEDMAQTNTVKSTGKMRWLHRPKDVQKFLDAFRNDMEKQAALMDAHDADRAMWLQRVELRKAFETHYDTAEDALYPACAYMRDVQGVLVGWGSVSIALEPAIRELLDSEPMKASGWALRALVANQKGLYSEQDTYLKFANDWLFSMDNKLDKSYDTLRGALFNEEGFRLSSRWRWLKPATAGLSLGIAGFLSGAATQLAAFAADRASKGYARNAMEELEKQHRFIDAETGLVKDAETINAMKREARIQAWCHQLTLLLHGFLQQKPPQRPVYVRMRLNGGEAAQVLLDARARGVRFTEETLKAQKKWNELPELFKQRKVELDILTTDDAFQEALKKSRDRIRTVAAGASDVQVAVKTTLAALPGTTFIGIEELGKLTRDAHRFDDLKDAVSGMLAKTAPEAEARVARELAGTNSDIGWKRGMSGAAALLQARLLYGNAMKWSMLKNKLRTIPNLSAEQRKAIDDELTLVDAGLTDNTAGVLGGIFEVKSLTAKAAKLESKALFFEGLAALAGSIGAGANAYAMFAKAEGKAREGDAVFEKWYNYVGFAYSAAAGILFANSAALLAKWLAEKGIIRLGGALLAVVEFGATKLTPFGWFVTIVAFVGEGYVSLNDLTPIELWIKECCFGTGRIVRSAEKEEEAYLDAVKGMEEQAIRETDAKPGAWTPPPDTSDDPSPKKAR
jgi:hypothetical protein